MALAPVGLLAIVLTPLVGKKVAVWAPRWMASLAFVIFFVVLYRRAGFTTQTDLAHIMVPTLLQGPGMALFFIPLTTVSLSGLDPARLPAAAGLSNFVRITAGAMGTSIATTLWESRAALHHAHLAEGLQLGRGAMADALADALAGLGDGAALAQITRLIDQQAYTRAADDIFLASALIFLALIGLVWLTRRPAQIKPGALAVDAGGAH